MLVSYTKAAQETMLIIEIAAGIVLGLFAYSVLTNILHESSFRGLFSLIGWITALAIVMGFCLTIVAALIWGILDRKDFSQFIHAHSIAIYVLAAFAFLFCLFVGFLVDRSDKKRAGAT